MKKYDLVTPEGTRDFLFEQCDAIREIQGNLKKLFKSKSFSEVITPTFEFYDVYDNKNIYIPQEHMYKLIDQKGRILVLRPDSTAPIARIAATRLKNQEMPIRLFYNQDIFRVSPKLSGSDDILNQLGIELIGNGNIKSDMEIIYTAFESMMCATKNKQFRIEIGHIGIFKYLIDKINIDESTKEDIRKNIERKNYAALNDVLSHLEQNQYTKAIKQLPELFGNDEVFQKAENLFKDPAILKILAYLKKIYTFAKDAGFGNSLMIDLGIVNEADYYTGIIFKGYIEGSGDVILSGGRYDGLIEKYGKNLPAIGFGLNINFIANAFSETIKSEIKCDYLVFAEEKYIGIAMKFIENQNEEGKICEFSCDDSLLEAKEYAKKMQIKKIAIITETADIIDL